MYRFLFESCDCILIQLILPRLCIYSKSILLDNEFVVEAIHVFDVVYFECNGHDELCLYVKKKYLKILLAKNSVFSIFSAVRVVFLRGVYGFNFCRSCVTSVTALHKPLIIS
jgi:hypothetical protein